ncbi:MAG TPA: penicillin-binding transpeptidase domain-containing protein, partial [Holophagaceae bacterium]|nr:penicillin-binding transpeptidase domain-containing protein [Holophagaceae bacterium]
VGGYDFEKSKFNRALQAQRQVGSTMKAFVYGAAFEKGFTPATIVNDVPTRFLDSAQYAVVTLPDGRTEAKTLRPGGKPYEPKNYEHNFWGPIPVWEAIRDSRNVPAVRTLAQVGAPAVTDFARRCGLEGDVPPYPSMALGSADLTLQEMTRAYATIGNMGMQTPEPFLIKKVVDRMGNTLEMHAGAASEQVIDKATAFQLIQCFQGVAQRGTASRTNALNWPVAGKTGTTDDHTDAWFLGFSTRIACGVWVGLDEKKTIYRGADGGHVAVPIWTDFMKAVLPSTPREDFKAPEGMEWAEIDRLTGLLAGGGSSDILKLAFKPGTLPTSGSDDDAVKKITAARAAAPTQPMENILWGRPTGVPPMPDQTPGLGGSDPNK